MRKFLLFILTFSLLSADHGETIKTLSSLFYPDYWESELKSFTEDGYLNTTLDTKEDAPFIASIACETWDQEIAINHTCKTKEDYVDRVLELASRNIGCNLHVSNHTIEYFRYSYLFTSGETALIQLSYGFNQGTSKCRSEAFILLKINDKEGKAVILEFDLINEELFEELCSPEFIEKCVNAMTALTI